MKRNQSSYIDESFEERWNRARNHKETAEERAERMRKRLGKDNQESFEERKRRRLGDD